MVSNIEKLLLLTIAALSFGCSNQPPDDYCIELPPANTTADPVMPEDTIVLAVVNADLMPWPDEAGHQTLSGIVEGTNIEGVEDGEIIDIIFENKIGEKPTVLSGEMMTAYPVDLEASPKKFKANYWYSFRENNDE